MRILHTADWHLGQLFHMYERQAEHQAFLDWLKTYIVDQAIDVLLVSGDVFDTANPAASSIRQLYQFLGELQLQAPRLQIILTAGNHDSAQRIEAAQPLVNSQRVHLIGTITRNADGSIDYDKVCIPLSDDNNQTAWICLAVPYLRAGDYPQSGVGYAEGVTAFYQEAVAYAQAHYPSLPLIGMGHLHAMNAELSDMDKTERPIMGGLEYIPAHAFDPALQYVALGHIHKAQWIGSDQRIRYSGSPLPLSFTEHNYRHQVSVVVLDHEKVVDYQSVSIPEITPLLRIPAMPKPLPEVLACIAQQPAAPADKIPYVGIHVLLDQPQPQLRFAIEQAIAAKNWKLAQITTHYPSTNHGVDEKMQSRKNLDDLKPLDVMQDFYRRRFDQELPTELQQRFVECLNAVHENESR